MRGGIQQKTFEQMVSGFGYTTEIVPADSPEDVFRAVGTGAADAATTNHRFGEYCHTEYGRVRTSVVFQARQLTAWVRAALDAPPAP